MYGNIGSFSGIVHMVARRPVLAATVVLATVIVANVPSTPPPPPAPPTPAVVEVMTAKPEPTPVISRDPVSYSCEFTKNSAPTNLCKATLDSVATFLNGNSAATITVSGSMNHVLAVRKYFTQSEAKFGIASSRISVHIDDSDGNVVTIQQLQ